MFWADAFISVEAKQETVGPVMIFSLIENSLSEVIGGKLHDTWRFLCLQLSYQERLRAQFRIVCLLYVELCLDRDGGVVSDKLIVFGTWVAKGEENHFHKINSCFETTLKLI